MSSHEIKVSNKLPNLKVSTKISQVKYDALTCSDTCAKAMGLSLVPYLIKLYGNDAQFVLEQINSGLIFLKKACANFQLFKTMTHKNFKYIHKKGKSSY